MRPVIIFGAGALATEFLAVVKNKCHVKGFVAETGITSPSLQRAFQSSNGIKLDDTCVYSSLKEALKAHPDVINILIAVFDPAVKARVYNLIEPPVCLYSAFHPTSLVDDLANLNEGTYLDAYSTISHGTSIGKCVLVGRHSNLGHENHIGSFVSIGPGVILTRNVVLDDKIVIGANSVIMPEVKISAGVKIGPNSVVARNIHEPNSVWMGNPARRVR